MTPANDNPKADDGTASRTPPGAAGFAAIAGAIVLVAILAGIASVGSPATARMLRLDQQRVQDLQILNTSVLNFDRAEGRLPASLEELLASHKYNSLRPTTDPETGTPYEIVAAGDRDYALCATFAVPSPAEPNGLGPWAHGAGHQCIKQTAAARK